MPQGLGYIGMNGIYTPMLPYRITMQVSLKLSDGGIAALRRCRGRVYANHAIACCSANFCYSSLCIATRHLCVPYQLESEYPGARLACERRETAAGD